MKTLMSVGLLSFIAFGGWWWFVVRGEDKAAPTGDQVKTQEGKALDSLQKQEPSMGSDDSSVPLRIEDILPPAPKPPPKESGSKSAEEDKEGEKDVLSEETMRIESQQHLAREWLVKYRKLIGGMLHLWALEREVPAAIGIEQVNINDLHNSLTEELEKMNLESEGAMQALQSLQEKMDSVIQSLSDAPQLHELDAAKVAIDEISTELQNAYSAVEQWD